MVKYGRKEEDIMEKKLRLRLILKLLKAAIEVLELEIDREIDRRNNDTWISKNSENYNNHNRNNYDNSAGDNSPFR